MPSFRPWPWMVQPSPSANFLIRLNSLDDLVDLNTINEPDGCSFLRAAVQAKLNILFAGATGAGKTATLTCLVP